MITVNMICPWLAGALYGLTTRRRLPVGSGRLWLCCVPGPSARHLRPHAPAGDTLAPSSGRALSGPKRSLPALVLRKLSLIFGDKNVTDDNVLFFI